MNFGVFGSPLKNVNQGTTSYNAYKQRTASNSHVNATENVGVTEKSFGSLLNSPYQGAVLKSLQSERSIESPYTSLGSGQSSYASIRNQQDDYRFLRARAAKASEVHEHKSKAVMDALQGLQKKIKRLESDRVKAEDNLKSLATETSDYKQLLKQKQALEKSASTPNDSHSRELEHQLEHAQMKCDVLEKEVMYMREMIHNNQFQKSPIHKISPTTIEKRKYSPNTVTFSPDTASSSEPQITSSAHDFNRRLNNMDSQSPAIEKLNELEKEHRKLTESQEVAEVKIKQLEEKIKKETHYRKLLQDKAIKLQDAVSTNKVRQLTDAAAENPIATTKKVNRKKKKTTSPIDRLKEVQMSPRKVMSPSEYLQDPHNIPFVVGQSTTPSHSLGANVQNVLSIMKAHNKLCNTTSSKNDRRSNSTLDSNLNELLKTLQDEFAQLGFEHYNMSSQLPKIEDERTREEFEKELEQILFKMERKGHQINSVRDQLKDLSKSKKVSTKTLNSKQTKTVRLCESQEIEIVTTVRTKNKNKQNSVVSNPNLELFKKVRKLQCTLRKDDLKWE